MILAYWGYQAVILGNMLIEIAVMRMNISQKGREHALGYVKQGFRVRPLNGTRDTSDQSHHANFFFKKGYKRMQSQLKITQTYFAKSQLVDWSKMKSTQGRIYLAEFFLLFLR